MLISFIQDQVTVWLAMRAVLMSRENILIKRLELQMNVKQGYILMKIKLVNHGKITLEFP